MKKFILMRTCTCACPFVKKYFFKCAEKEKREIWR